MRAVYGIWSEQQEIIRWGGRVKSGGDRGKVDDSVIKLLSVAPKLGLKMARKPNRAGTSNAGGGGEDTAFIAMRRGGGEHESKMAWLPQISSA